MGHRIKVAPAAQGPRCTVGITGSPADIIVTARGSSATRRTVAGPRLLERRAADDLAVAHQRDEQGPVVAVVLGRLADADDLGLRDAGGPTRRRRAYLRPPIESLSVDFFATDTSSPSSPSRATSL